VTGVQTCALPTITKAVKDALPKLTRRKIFNDLMDQSKEKLAEKLGESEDKAEAEYRANVQKTAAGFMDKIIKNEVRRLILEEGIRMSSRKVTQIRPLSAIVDILPNRVHGSALFQRGETQGLTTCTLGAPGDKQLVEDACYVSWLYKECQGDLFDKIDLAVEMTAEFF
jgi:polyribonucleotide nucleotidyltransferase